MTFQKILETFIAKQIIKREQFSNGGANMDLESIQAAYGTAGIWSFFILTFVTYLVLMLIGKWLWNTVVVDMVSVARPIESVFQLIGLSIIVKLVVY
jgi:hypothetical protein